MYRNYIFDLYGTLADIRTDEEDMRLWEKVSEIYHAFGAAYTPAELKKTFRKLEQAQERSKEKQFAESQSVKDQSAGDLVTKIPLADQVEVDLTEVFAQLYREKGVDCSPELARITAVTFRTLSRSHLELYDGVLDFLKELKKRKKKIYLLSNAQADFTRPEISMLGIEPYFDGIFLSSEQGVKKPSPAFFRKLLTTYGLDPAESVMIGNDELADIAGAREAGMDSLYIHTVISPKETGKAEASYRVMDGDFRKIKGLLLKEQ